MASSSWFLVCSLEKIAQPPHCFLIRVAESGRLARGAVGGARVRSPLDQPTRDGERRSMCFVGEPGETDWLSETRRGVEDHLRRVHGAHQSRAASRDNDARRQELVESRLAHFLARHLEDLHHPRSDDLRPESAGQGPGGIAAPLANPHPLSLVYYLPPRRAGGWAQA